MRVHFECQADRHQLTDKMTSNRDECSGESNAGQCAGQRVLGWEGRAGILILICLLETVCEGVTSKLRLKLYYVEDPAENRENSVPGRRKSKCRELKAGTQRQCN